MTEFENRKDETEMMEEHNAEKREPKNKFWKGVLAGSLVTAFCGICVVALASGIWMLGRHGSIGGGESGTITANTDNGSNGPMAAEETGDEKLDLERISAKLKAIETAIDKYFLFDEEDKDADALTAEDWIYTTYVMSFNDPYSSYYTAEDYKSLMESTEGEYCGVGVMVSQDVNTGYISVLKVFKDAPADEAGMLPGDMIVAVEGTDVVGIDLSLVVSDYIKGEEGTEVTVTVYRESEKRNLDLTMKRAIVQNPTVEYEMLEDKVGYVSLSSFEMVSLEQFIKAVDDLESQGMEYFVLDLRNNSGGVVEVAEKIADYILPEGLDVVSFKGKAVKDSTYVTKDQHQLDLPMAVLVNGYSASASEILSGALGEHDAASIVGTKTYGKGIAQGLFEIPDGSALKLTTAYYYLPSGVCIHKEGIAPDIEVDLEKELKTMVEVPKEKDNQLQAAIGVLLEGEDAVRERLEAEKAMAELNETETASESENTSESENDADSKKED